MRNGWHIIEGYEVCIKDNRVICGIKTDNNNNSIMACPYRKRVDHGIKERNYNEWVACSGISIKEFKSGVLNETVSMR